MNGGCFELSHSEHRVSKYLSSPTLQASRNYYTTFKPSQPPPLSPASTQPICHKTAHHVLARRRFDWFSLRQHKVFATMELGMTRMNSSRRSRPLIRHGKTLDQQGDVVAA